MSDKILTEAFDKLKAIEESEDPFCIGATGDTENAGYTAVNEAEPETDGDFEHGKRPERESDRVEPTVFQIETDSGDDYVIEIQQDGGKERAFVEANGITVATFTVGGAGSMDAQIQKPDEVMNMLAAAMQQASRR